MNSSSDLQALSAAIEEQADLIEKCADPATRAAALELLRSVAKPFPPDFKFDREEANER